MSRFGDLLNQTPVFLDSIERTASLYDRFANRGAQQKRQEMQDQMAALQLTDAVATSQQRAALRPLEIEQAQAQQQERQRTQRQQEAKDAHAWIQASNLLASERDLPEPLRQQFMGVLNRQHGHQVDNDGTGKRGYDFARAPDGQNRVMVLDVPQADGTVTKAPLTLDRTPNTDVRLFGPDDFLTINEAAKDHYATLWGVSREQVPAIAAQYNAAMGGALKLLSGEKPEAKYGALTTQAGFVGQTEEGTGQFHKIGEAPNPLKERKERAEISVNEARAAAIRSGGRNGGGGAAKQSPLMTEAVERQKLYGGNLADHYTAVAEERYGKGSANRNRAKSRLIMQRVENGELTIDRANEEIDKLFGSSAPALSPKPVAPAPRGNLKVKSAYAQTAEGGNFLRIYNNAHTSTETRLAMEKKLRDMKQAEE